MKGKIKRVMALLLSLIMVLTMLPTTAFAAEEKIEIDTIEATLSVPVAGEDASTLELTVPAGRLR